jgi:hypothetical protein
LPSARGERPQSEKECHHRSSGKPDLLLATAQTFADQHREWQAEQGRCAIEPVNQLLWPIAGCYEYEPDDHLNADQRNLNAEIQSDRRKDAWANKSGYRGDRANRGYEHQYETVPIVEEHAAYGRRQVRQPKACAPVTRVRTATRIARTMPRRVKGHIREWRRSLDSSDLRPFRRAWMTTHTRA